MTGAWTPYAFRMPLFHALVALLMKVFGAGIAWPLAIVNLGLSVVVVALTVRLGTHLGGARAGIIAGLLMAASPNALYHTADLLAALLAAARTLTPAFEIVVVDGGSKDGTVARAERFGPPVRVLRQTAPGYACAIREGFAATHGRYLITLDADLSHPPALLPELWRFRDEGEMVIASRYVPGGSARMPLLRAMASRTLNGFFRRGLSLPVRDLSSGYRLYHSVILRDLELASRDFDILAEIAVRIYSGGWRITEVPFAYAPRAGGHSKAKVLRFGWSFLRTFGRMWRLRNSIQSADYDDRAYDSRIPLQRFWQRRRFRIVTGFARGASLTLDVGCGSSRILSGLDRAVGLDVQAGKARYARRFGKPVVRGTVFALPFRDATFDCVICSQVLEHLPAGEEPFRELLRVLKPGGRLIVGTPDYGPPWWRIFEAGYGFFAPGGYADEHITRYTQDQLRSLFGRHGIQIEEVAYILGAEMIISGRRSPEG